MVVQGLSFQVHGNSLEVCPLERHWEFLEVHKRGPFLSAPASSLPFQVPLSESLHRVNSPGRAAPAGAPLEEGIFNRQHAARQLPKCKRGLSMGVSKRVSRFHTGCPEHGFDDYGTPRSC